MKKVSLKKIRITKLSNFEQASINGGNNLEAEGSKVWPCTVFKNTKEDCPPWEDEIIGL